MWASCDEFAASDHGDLGRCAGASLGGFPLVLQVGSCTDRDT
jgi:hypothetical protein